ncbi:MAG: hypothetical protein VX874_15680 [Pseudomonadota bacterium]|nr:hypothetical protein [Pseudomonadota bacterium]
MSDVEFFKVERPFVSEITVSCGCCGRTFVFGFEDFGEGQIAPEHAFGNCPECGEVYDATDVRFQNELEGGAK